MIEVHKVTKRFAATIAVDEISFRVEKGMIAGFVGPNGAGKTTTMRILACLIPPTSGRASVAGYDVTTQSLDVRRRIGYMPENVPFYGEMRVRDYLSYRAELKDVPARRRRRRVDEVMERCRIKDVGTKLVGRLSKGYRQRVGLADCLVHEPEILILDEPTIGLDPNQIRETRRLVKELRQRHTVLFSTHLLHEVEMMCDEVIMINEGRIVASDSLARLLSRGERPSLALTVRGDGQAVQAALVKLAEVAAVEWKERGIESTFLVKLKEPAVAKAKAGKPAGAQEAVWRAAAGAGVVVTGLSHQRRTLEDVFVELVRGKGDRHAA